MNDQTNRPPLFPDPLPRNELRDSERFRRRSEFRELPPSKVCAFLTVARVAFVRFWLSRGAGSLSRPLPKDSKETNLRQSVTKMTPKSPHNETGPERNVSVSIY